MARIKGTRHNDHLVGTDASDQILTSVGNDEVHGGGGDDVIAGGVGIFDPYVPAGAKVVDTDGNSGDGFAVVGGDRLYGDAGDDTIYVGYDSVADGGADTDTAVVDLYYQYEHHTAHSILSWFNDLAVDVDFADQSVTLNVGGLGDLTVTLDNFERFDITFGSGDDRAFGAGLDDIFHGGADYGSLIGNDEFHGRGGDDQLFGQGGADTLYGDDGDDVLEAGDSNTLFFEDYASDYLSGGAGDDELVGGRGDVFDGGDGYDRATINLASSTFSYRLDLDALVGTGAVNFGDGGEDKHFVHAGTTTANLENIIALVLGSGNDVVTGSASALGGLGAVNNVYLGLYMGAGNDTVHLVGRIGDDGACPVFGEAGNDRLTLDGDYSRPFELGFATVTGFETIVLAAGHDYDLETTIDFDAKLIDGSALGSGDHLSLANGEARAVTVIGGAGDDVISSWLRADTLFGGGGDDVLAGGKGNDALDGGAGIDTASYADATQAVTVDLSRTDAQDTGGDGIDTLVAIENLTGSARDDTLTGNAGDNVLIGGGGNDALGGGDGDDRLIGGRGSDTLTGGAGADTFLIASTAETRTLAASDLIVDFNASQHDVIDLTGIDAIARTTGDDAFAFIGDAAFSRHAGELRAYLDGTTTIVAGDVTGDGKADFFLRIDGAPTLVASDFHL